MPGSVLLATLLFFAPPGSESPALTGPYAGLERSRPPARIGVYWTGLGRAESRAPAQGVVALRQPPPRRVRILGGSFTMGSTPSEMVRAVELCSKEAFGPKCRSLTTDVGPWIRAEGFAHEVVLADYELDATEVTVGAYERCVAASACAPPAFPAGDARFDRPDFPVTHVRWDDANAYCAWVSGRLPTEAEWEHAARGARRTTFPWGELWNSHLCNHGAYADDPHDGRDGFVGLAPVASFPDGRTPSGVYDLAGNVAEWVFDWYDRDEEGFGYRRGTQTNPKGPSFGVAGHVVRGGSYRDGPHWQRGAARRASPFSAREVGFRCAYDLGALSRPTPTP